MARINHLEVFATNEGRRAWAEGKGRDANPYMVWHPRAGRLVTGMLGGLWLNGWNHEAGRPMLEGMTDAEAQRAVTRCRAERAAYDATRDPAAAARNEARKVRKRRARERKLAAAAAH